MFGKRPRKGGPRRRKGGRNRKGGKRPSKGGKRPSKGAPPAVAVDPVVGNEAAAVGDPHLTHNTGSNEDLCCNSGICEPCPVSLKQDPLPDDPTLMGEDEMFGKRPRKG